ncbi:unnamed protein product [Strongylus vulgaris]|uniref:PurM-like C-terminal domain-containing protein n=1 Tax=Strongylus vulgaris TaxID=40348 RepID=A0A3P7L6S0_STRVU|nr:unnamed protein product [Strongylus vulgaris]
MSGNWMWAAKCEGEGARLVGACDALCKALAEVGCAIDGGKDSLSMAAKVGDELVKAPGTLVLSAYAPCPDITLVVTPNLKGPRAGSKSTCILYVRIGSSFKNNRLGGSALAQVLRQIGNDPADIEDMPSLARTFSKIQKLIVDGFVLSAHDVSDGGFIVALLEMAFAGNTSIRADIKSLAQVLRQIGSEPADIEDVPSLARTFTKIQKLIIDGFILSAHDVSDGGFIVALLEMAFAGNTSIRADIKCDTDPLTFLFAEEAGVFLEVEHEHLAEIMEQIENDASVLVVGEVYAIYGPDAKVEIILNGEYVINESLVSLREIWEETSDRLGLMQTDATCLEEAKEVRCTTKLVAYSAPFEWQAPSAFLNSSQYLTEAPRVAIIREEGSNGDREMAAAFAMSGFQPYDVTMTDLLSGHSLDQYRVVAFVGGFSYADVFGSAKGKCFA